jgi:hypothetical protein
MVPTASNVTTIYNSETTVTGNTSVIITFEIGVTNLKLLQVNSIYRCHCNQCETTLSASCLFLMSLLSPLRHPCGSTAVQLPV